MVRREIIGEEELGEGGVALWGVTEVGGMRGKKKKKSLVKAQGLTFREELLALNGIIKYIHIF